MNYRITAQFRDKTYTIEVTTFDVLQDLDMASLESSILGGLKHWKEQDGLNGLPHEIIKSKISLLRK